VTASIPTIPPALTVRQILAIDLGTDLFPALALGLERPEPDVMQHKPRPRNQPLLDRSLLGRAFWLGSIEAALCYIGFFAVYLFSGNAAILQIPFLTSIVVPPGFSFILSRDDVYRVAITVFHAGVVMSQVGNAFACRSSKIRSTRLGWFSNGYLWLGVLTEVVAIALLIYIPVLARVFNHDALPLRYWLGLILYAPVLYSLEWIRKAIIRRLDSARGDQPLAQV
jgi:Ca2+-transporting ATPase